MPEGIYDERGNSSAFGPQNGGDAFTPGEQAFANLRRRQGQAMMEYASNQDALSRFLFNSMQQGFAGGPNRMGDMGRVMQYGIGLANSRGIFGGGNPVDLMYGIQQAAGSGMRVNYGGQSFQFAGPGATTDMVSRHTFDMFQKNFYNNITGAAFTNKTAGLNKTDMGVLFNEIAGRGGFSGTNAGSMYFLRDEEARKQAISRASSPEEASSIQNMPLREMQFLADPNYEKKMVKTMEDSADAIASLRNIFGNRSIKELVRNSELLTGANVADSPAFVKAKLEQLNTVAQAHGLNPTAMANNMINANALNAQMVGNNRMGAAIGFNAATLAPGMMDLFNQSRQGLAGRGAYAEHVSSDAISSMLSADQAIILNETPELAALATVLQQENRSPAQKQRARDLMKKYAKTGAPEQRAGVLGEINSFMDDFGISATETVHHVGLPNILRTLSPETQGILSDTLVQNDMARMRTNEVSNIILSQGIAGDETFSKMRTQEIANAMQGIFGNFNANTQNDIITNIGNDAKLREIVTSRAGLFEGGMADAEKVLGDITNFRDKSGGDVTQNLQRLQTAYAGHSGLAAMSNREAMQDSQVKQVESFMRTGMLGADRRVAGSWVENFVNGMLGDVSIDNQAIANLAFAHGEEKDMAGLKRVGAGYEAEGWNLHRLSGVFGDEKLAEAFGTTDMGSIQKQLRTAEGAAKLNNMIMAGNKMTITDGDKLYIGDDTRKARLTKELENAATVSANEKALGRSLSEGEKRVLLGTSAADKGAQDSTKDKLIQSIQGNLASLGATNDEHALEQNITALKKTMGGAEPVKALLAQQEKTIRAQAKDGKLDETQKGQLENLNKLRDRIEGNRPNRWNGVVTLEAGKNVQMQLTQTSP